MKMKNHSRPIFQLRAAEAAKARNAFAKYILTNVESSWQWSVVTLGNLIWLDNIEMGTRSDHAVTAKECEEAGDDFSGIWKQLSACQVAND